MQQKYLIGYLKVANKQKYLRKLKVAEKSAAVQEIVFCYKI